MRLLFIQAALDSSPEYGVHRLLADNAPTDQVECFFISQTTTNPQLLAEQSQLDPTYNFWWDFGRDLSLTPKPSKPYRAWLMANRLPGSLRFLAQKIDQIRPDVIYTCQQRYDLRLVSLLRPFYKQPHLIHIQYPVGPWLGKHAVKTILKTPYLLGVSQFIQDGAIASGVPPQNIDYMLHPADLQHYNLAKNRLRLREEWGWEPNTPVILAAARLDPSKGYMLLLDGFARVQREMPQARLLICGKTSMDGGYDLKIKQRVHDLGLSDKVAFAGHRYDLPDLFAGADLFCLPTEDDACPLVFLFAMAAGLPTVAIQSGAVPELVYHGETGLLSEPGDATTLADHLLKCLQDPELAAKMGEAGRTRALRDFNPADVAAHWVKLVQRTLNSTSMAPRPVHPDKGTFSYKQNSSVDKEVSLKV